MKNQILQCEKYSKSYYMPFYWKGNIDIAEQIEHFNSLRKSQKVLMTILMDKAEFINNLNFEAAIKNVKEIYSERKKNVETLQKYCKNYGFKNETCFKAIQIFDLYVHKYLNLTIDKIKLESKYSNNNFSFKNELMFTSVVCLNIACKLEEVNCNYTLFFKENMLDNKLKDIFFSLKEMTGKEVQILKTLNFKVNSPTFYQFNNLLTHIFLGELVKLIVTESKLNFNQTLETILKTFITHNDSVTKSYSLLNESVFNSPLTSGLICFQTTLFVITNYFENGINLFNFLSHRMDNILLGLINNCEYLQKVKSEALKFLSNLRIFEKENNSYNSKLNVFNTVSNVMSVDIC